MPSRERGRKCHFSYRAHDVFTISKISVCTKPTVISSISTGVFFPVNQAVFFVQTFFETYKFAQQIFFGPENWLLLSEGKYIIIGQDNLVSNYEIFVRPMKKISAGGWKVHLIIKSVSVCVSVCPCVCVRPKIVHLNFYLCVCVRPKIVDKNVSNIKHTNLRTLNHLCRK